MPLDERLPPPLLPAAAESGDIARHFRLAYGIVVDPAAQGALPAMERLTLAPARLPEPPEAVLLDRVLRLVPRALLTPVEAVLVVAGRGVGRHGGARGGIVRVSAQEARLREGDPSYGRAFSLFTTTVLHEIGHVIFEASLSDAQREQVSEMYLAYLVPQAMVPAGEPSQAGVEHYFIALLTAALLGRGEFPVTASVARRVLAALGVEWRVEQRGGAS